jgi:hypothetical protein
MDSTTVYGLEIEQLPENTTPFEAVVVIKVLGADGSPELWTRTTDGLNSWERLGMLEIAAYSTKRTLQDGFEAG